MRSLSYIEEVIYNRILSMNRADFMELSDLRLQEAEILLEKNQYSRAYYLAGYSVELALKAGMLLERDNLLTS